MLISPSNVTDDKHKIVGLLWHPECIRNTFLWHIGLFHSTDHSFISKFGVTFSFVQLIALQEELMLALGTDAFMDRKTNGIMRLSRMEKCVNIKMATNLANGKAQWGVSVNR